jgi:hypothetical protein
MTGKCDPDPADGPATGRQGQPAVAAPGHRIGQYAHLQQCWRVVVLALILGTRFAHSLEH